MQSADAACSYGTPELAANNNKKDMNDNPWVACLPIEEMENRANSWD